MLDRYYSPPWWLDILFDDASVALDVAEPRHCLEPFAGQALALAGRMSERGHYVETADIDPEAPALHHVDSFAHEWGHYDAVVSNPPFTVGSGIHTRRASDAVRLFVPRSRLFAAFLMRLSWLEPCDDRADILTQFPPDRVIVLPRFSFRGTGTDLVTVAWYVWTHRRAATRNSLRVISKEEDARYRVAYEIDKRRRMALTQRTENMK